MSDLPTPTQPSLLIDGPGGSPQVDPTLVVDTSVVAAERAVLGSRAIGAAALSEFAHPTIEVTPTPRSISGLSEAASARETAAVASQLADSPNIRPNLHRARARSGRD